MKFSPLLLAALVASATATTPAHTGSPFDCAMRAYAYEYGQALQGWRGAKAMKQVFDSLQLATLCNQTYDGALFGSALPPAPVAAIPAGAAVAYVAASGAASARAQLNDVSAPFPTVHAAVAALRLVKRAEGERAWVVLRGGTHYLTRTLELGARDSFLSFVSHAGEAAAMSGAMPIDTAWKVHGKASTGATIYVADLSKQASEVKGVKGLRVDGRRAVRASYPDRDPELSIFPNGWISDAPGRPYTKWTPPIPPTTNETFVTVAKPMLEDKTMFQNYMVGVGGHCSLYTPPVSYWCSAHPSGGGAFSFRVPSGLTYKKLKKYSQKVASKSNPAIVNAWRPAHWANWMFEVDSWDSEKRELGWTKGGFQGARGNDIGGEWYIENVFEELDNANEYFYDDGSASLYYIVNGTGAPQAKFEAVVNQTIVKLLGSKEKPVKGVSFEGLAMRDSAYTYMEPHGVPSGGDWGLQRMGALHLEGTEGVTLKSCLITRVDGNAVMLSGYNRNTSIVKNEFVWIGDSVVASWGYTAPLGGAAGDEVLKQYRSGVDGRNGEQPRGTLLEQNFIHELGHFEKQSSPWFQAKSCLNTIHQNIFFNMPRAGINFNDGFGGGSIVTENLGYNTCRESSDHAVFNSWDRQPFLTEVGQKPGPKGDLNPAYNEIARNFFIGNYGASMAIDNDDGSSYYNIRQNFEVYGGHKSNFGGHNKIRSGALIPYSKVYQEGLCCRVNSQMHDAQHTDGYVNNTCIQSASNLTAYAFRYCDPKNVNNITNIGTIHGNKIYNPDGKATVQCGTSPSEKDPKATGKLLTLAEFEASGADPGEMVAVTPADDVIIGWAKKLLQPLSATHYKE